MTRTQPFGRYELLRRISSGGMAEVFHAVHQPTQKHVALKRILPEIAEDEEFIHMFEDEARIASQLEHPHIARCLDFGRVTNAWFIAFEFVDGKDLRTLFDRTVRQKGQLPLQFVVHVLSRIAEGLAYAHARRDPLTGAPVSIVHRDVSPQNIIVSFTGDVKLIDFGIAKAAGKLSRTQVGTIKGKFGYMSPEQVAGGEVDQRADVFSLGICMWELLTMTRLFHAENEILVLEKIRRFQVPPPSVHNSEVPPELDRIVLKALAKDLDERYRSAKEFYRELNHLAESNNLVATRDQIAQYMRRVFPEANDRQGGGGTTARDTRLQETHAMAADNKGGSDLDIFEGLGKKTTTRPPASATRPLPPGPPPARTVDPAKKTLVGLQAPASSSNMVAAPAVRTPPPPPPGRGSLPQVVPPPVKPGSNPPAPPGKLPPPAFASNTQVMPGPPVTNGAPATPPPPLPPPPAAAAAAVAPVPSGQNPSLDMDWDDEDEATHIFDKQGEEGSGVKQEFGTKPTPAAGTPPPPAAALPPPKAPPEPATRPGAPTPSLMGTLMMDQAPPPPPGMPSKSPSARPLPPPAPPPSVGTAFARASGQAAAAPGPVAFPPPPPPGTSPSVLPPPPPPGGGATMPMGAAAEPQTSTVPLPMPGLPPPTRGPSVPAPRLPDPAPVPMSAPPNRMEATAMVRPQGSSKGWIAAVVALVVLLAVGAAAFFMLMPKQGRIVVNVTDSKGLNVARTEIFVDGKKQCETSPCIIDQVPAGSHKVRVLAPGYEEPGIKDVVVEARKDSSMAFDVGGATSNSVANQPSKSGTGIKVSGGQPGVKLLIDGKEIGPLPQEIRDLAPGDHTVRVQGTERYEAAEKKIIVAKDEMLDLGTMTLKVLKGKATITLGTPGAKVFLVSGTDRRELPNLPLAVDLDASKEWVLEGSKTGLTDYRQKISFEDGQAEKSFTVTLDAKGTVPSATVALTQTTATTAATAPATTAPPVAQEQGYLNINSVPPSTIFLDNRPLGSTPKMKWPVSPGAHTIRFVNSELNLTKTISVTVGPGETKLAVTKLN